jgi:hypothetical protein
MGRAKLSNTKIKKWKYYKNCLEGIPKRTILNGDCYRGSIVERDTRNMLLLYMWIIKHLLVIFVSFT